MDVNFICFCCPGQKVFKLRLEPIHSQLKLSHILRSKFKVQFKVHLLTKEEVETSWIIFFSSKLDSTDFLFFTLVITSVSHVHTLKRSWSSKPGTTLLHADGDRQVDEVAIFRCCWSGFSHPRRMPRLRAVKITVEYLVYTGVALSTNNWLCNCHS